MPIAVLYLMYREQLIPCCPSGTPRLLDKDELAMESQQGAEGPAVEQNEHEAGGKDIDGKIFALGLFQSGKIHNFHDFPTSLDKKQRNELHFVCTNLSFCDFLPCYRSWEYL